MESFALGSVRPLIFGAATALFGLLLVIETLLYRSSDGRRRVCLHSAGTPSPSDGNTLVLKGEGRCSRMTVVRLAPAATPYACARAPAAG